MKDLRVIKTDKLIVDSFYRLLRTKAFERLTITDICNESLIGRSTFYQHYVDKYELLEKENAHYTSLLQQAMDDRMSSFSNADSLKKFIRYLEPSAERILALLAIHAEKIDLQIDFEQIIGESLNSLLERTKIAIPNEFTKTIYATNVMTFIKWSLENGIDDNIVDFMNKSFDSIMSYWIIE